MAIVAIDVAACEAPIGRLVAAEGLVEVKEEAAATWVAVKSGHPLCRSDRVAVRAEGRAAVVLDNEVMIRLDRNTTLTLTEVAADRDSQVGLIQGIVHVVSRFRKRFGISTPFVNAMVDGTEFTVASDTAKARVTVDEGRVRTLNDRGEQLVVAGEAAEAEAGMAPHGIVVHPLDAIAWAIHYPMVVWVDDAELSRLDEPLAATVRRVRALAVLARYGDALSLAEAQQGRSDALAALRANLLLALGRSDEANEAGGTLISAAAAAALQAIVAVARNRTEPALAAAQRAVAADAHSAAARMALSYALQGQRQLNQALVEAVRATELAPANPVAWARRAELELSMARLAAGRDSAGRALQLAPDMPRARAMLGIAQLLDRDATGALATLEAAVAADPADPLAHFGLGLVHVKQNDIERGRREIEIAVLLDPTNAELRSYLGRAYLEESRSSPAAAEFAVARRLDPASPTPWYFDAFRKLRDGDPLGAIADGEEAIARNDSRAVLRPSELIDQDRAARSASLGEAYREVGLVQPLLGAARTALEDDPRSPAAHRLLADAYADMPRFETARVSEQFQAELRQPIGRWPVGPQFVLPNLPVLQGPLALSQDEATALFDSKPYRLAASLVGGEHGTVGNSLLAARAWEQGQVSFGEFNYRADGFRAGAKVDLSGNRLAAQVASATDTMFYAEARNSRRIGGDVTERLLGDSSGTDHRQDVQAELGRLGVRHEISTNEQMLCALTFGRREERTLDRQIVDPSIPVSFRTDFSDTIQDRDLSLQYVNVGQVYTVVAGGSMFREHRNELASQNLEFPGNNVSVGDTIQPRTVLHDSVYVYLQSRVDPRWVVNSGFGYHRYSEEGYSSSSRLHGKFGLSFEPNSDSSLRLAFVQGIKGVLSEGQTFEPTQFVGFNQLFDDPNGTRSTRKAIAFDHRFVSGLRSGAEWSIRKLVVPKAVDGNESIAHWRERAHGAYIAMPVAGAVFSAHWRYESTTLDDTRPNLADTTLPNILRTETLPLKLWLRLAEKMTLRAEVVAARQQAEFSGPSGPIEATSKFAVTNLHLGFHTGSSPWSFRIDIYNLLDRQFRFQNTDLNAQPRVPLFYPVRSLVVQANARF